MGFGVFLAFTNTHTRTSLGIGYGAEEVSTMELGKVRFHRSLSLRLLPVFTDLWQMHFISAKQGKKMTKNIKPSHFIALSLIEKSNKEERRAEVQPSRVIRQMTTLFTAHVRVGDVGAAVVAFAVDASHISLIDLSIAIKQNSI